MVGTVHWIDGPWKGRLAIVARPRGGEWLADEIQQWRKAGLDVVVSLLTPAETAELALRREQELVERAQMQFLSFPIVDRGVPLSLWETRAFVEALHGLLSAGKNIGVHCRQSVGRSSLIVASLLVYAGSDVETAFGRIQAARACAAPETAEQRQWVERFAALAAQPAL
jgi:protein-tyrosine phosphatase